MKMNKSQGIWKSPEGKLISYVRETSQLLFDTNDFTNYFLQITKWSKNTSIEILEIFSIDSFDVENIHVEEIIYHFCKLPHNEFEAQRDELIVQAIALADRKFNSNSSELQESFEEHRRKL